MPFSRFLRRLILSVSLPAALIGAVALGTPADAAKNPLPKVEFIGLDSPRMDQNTTSNVTMIGVSEGEFRIEWGDGEFTTIKTICNKNKLGKSLNPCVTTIKEWYTLIQSNNEFESRNLRRSLRNRCVAATALRKPQLCTLKFDHQFYDLGTFSIAVKSGNTVLGTRTITVRDQPRPWRPPTGWVAPGTWTLLSTGAFFLPCSTVTWFYDSSQQPSDRGLAYIELPSAFAVLAGETGLTFVETKVESEAKIYVGWDTNSDGAWARTSISGFAPWLQNGSVRVTFNTLVESRNEYLRLTLHELMHALGFGHNDKHSIVGAVWDWSKPPLSEIDLDGLHTLYLNNSCPV